MNGASERVALVTGASRGIGFSVAERLISDGWAVGCMSRTGAGPGGGYPLEADVRQDDQVRDAYEKLVIHAGSVSAVVCAAGVTDDQIFARASISSFQECLDLNLLGAVRVCREAIRPMVSARRGRVVLVSSVAGVRGSAGQTNYASSKSAMIGFARSLAREVATRGVTVNVVLPGMIDTDMLGQLSPSVRSKMLEDVPAARVGAPSEVASAVSWLLSDEASYVTGAVIPVDGGLSMGF